jgi:hypothetical protein
MGMGMPMPMMMPTPGVMPGMPGMGMINAMPGRFGRDMLGRGESTQSVFVNHNADYCTRLCWTRRRWCQVSRPLIFLFALVSLLNALQSTIQTTGSLSPPVSPAFNRWMPS